MLGQSLAAPSLYAVQPLGQTAGQKDNVLSLVFHPAGWQDECWAGTERETCSKILPMGERAAVSKYTLSNWLLQPDGALNGVVRGWIVRDAVAVAVVEVMVPSSRGR